MDEKTGFTVTDRRKFTSEGDLRDDAVSTAAEEVAEPAAQKPAAEKVVSMPRREVAVEEAGAPEAAAGETEAEDAEEGRAITDEESAEQHAAYQASSDTLDQMLKQANPGMEAAGPVTFEHVIQSIYLSAMIAMGAGTEPGQKPRVDILGARQSVDMLSVLQEKTKGNLSERESRMLQNALFELRMMFLEITNAIAQAAHQPPKGKG
ncbi:MAG: DUF1844 domain-containing protein [Acidobacteriaceae bacterium]